MLFRSTLLRAGVGIVLVAGSVAAANAQSQGDRAVGGAVIGGVTGAIIGGAVTGRAGGAAAGAVIGGVTGAAIGASTAPRRGGSYYYWSGNRCYYHYPNGRVTQVGSRNCY